MSKKNPVAKYMEKFNKPSTQKDRKKASKRGYQKHKNSHIREFFFCLTNWLLWITIRKQCQHLLLKTY